MKIILAGGTILRDYDVWSGELEHEGSGLSDCLDDMMLKNQPEICFWELHDSLGMRDGNREALYQYCKKVKDRRLLVIHGTDTMSETHEYFRQQVLGPKNTRKTIVFTGAFFPLCVRGTDAEFNLGFGIACAKTLPEGNYVAMNGEIFVKDVKKDFENLTFEGRTL